MGMACSRDLPDSNRNDTRKAGWKLQDEGEEPEMCYVRKVVQPWGVQAK